MAAVDEKTRAELGLAQGEGVQITRINNPMLAQAGLSAGDVILQVGRQAVGNAAVFNSAMKAFKSFTGSDGCTASTEGGPPNSAMWAKSFTGSNGNFGDNAGATACEATPETSSV